MDAEQIRSLVGKRVIVRGSFGLYETVVRKISPSGKFVKLGSSTADLSEAVLGWVPIGEADIVESLE